MKRAYLKKALMGILILTLGFSMGTQAALADSQPHKWVLDDWWDAASTGFWGNAVADPEDPNVSILHGSTVWEDNVNGYPGPFSYTEWKKKNLSLANGKMTSEIHILIGPEALDGERFGVSVAINDPAGTRLTEMMADFAATDNQTVTYSPTNEGVKYQITEDAIYTLRWEYRCDQEGNIYGKQFLITDGKIVAQTENEEPLATLGSAAKQVTARYMWFYCINVDGGIKVYTDLPAPPEPPQPLNVVAVTEMTLPQWFTENLTEKLTSDYKSDDTIVWFSSNNNVVSIKNKLMTTLKTGSATLTAKAGNGKIGSIKVTVTPQKVKGLKVKRNKKKMTVSWKQNNKACAYVVAYSTKKTKGFKTKTTFSTKFTIKKLKKGKTYYVKVRPIQVFEGKKYYGSYSELKKVKVK